MRFPFILVPGIEIVLSHTSQNVRFMRFSSHLPYSGNFLHVRGCVFVWGLIRMALGVQQYVKLQRSCILGSCLITFSESTEMTK